jgi:hypothetical protein
MWHLRCETVNACEQQHYVENNLKDIFTNDPTKDHIVPIQDHRIPLKKSRYRARFNEPLNIENSR